MNRFPADTLWNASCVIEDAQEMLLSAHSLLATLLPTLMPDETWIIDDVNEAQAALSDLPAAIRGCMDDHGWS